VYKKKEKMLLKDGIIDYCMKIIKEMMNYWKGYSVEEDGNVIGGEIMKKKLKKEKNEM
jgi:hypothetical protein